MWDNVDCVDAYVGTPYTIGEDEMCAAANGKDACYVSVMEGGGLFCHAIMPLYLCVRGGGGGRETDRQTDRQTGRQAGRQAGRQTDRDRQTDTDTDRQTDRHRQRKR